ATAAGCGLLTALPLLVGAAGGAPAPVLTTLFLGLLAVSVLWPVAGARSVPYREAVPVLLLGVGAFALGRVLAAGSPAAPPATARRRAPGRCRPSPTPSPTCWWSCDPPRPSRRRRPGRPLRRRRPGHEPADRPPRPAAVRRGQHQHALPVGQAALVRRQRQRE